jgi:hypothetical protein
MTLCRQYSEDKRETGTKLREIEEQHMPTAGSDGLEVND